MMYQALINHVFNNETLFHFDCFLVCTDRSSIDIVCEPVFCFTWNLKESRNFSFHLFYFDINTEIYLDETDPGPHGCNDTRCLFSSVFIEYE